MEDDLSTWLEDRDLQEPGGFDMHQSYEGRPRVIGLLLFVLNYRDLWDVSEPVEDLDDAKAGWEAFRALAAAEGITVPPGRLLVTIDE